MLVVLMTIRLALRVAVTQLSSILHALRKVFRILDGDILTLSVREQDVAWRQFFLALLSTGRDRDRDKNGC